MIEVVVKVFEEWRYMFFEERVVVLFCVVVKVCRRKYEFFVLFVKEVGKFWNEVDVDIVEVIDFMEYYVC